MPEREQPAIAMHTLAAGMHTHARTHARSHAQAHTGDIDNQSTQANECNAEHISDGFIQVRSDSPGIFLPARWDTVAEQANVALVHLASRERIGTYCGSGV
jgi:hypothetical protein